MLEVPAYSLPQGDATCGNSDIYCHPITLCLTGVIMGCNVIPIFQNQHQGDENAC